MLKTLIAAVGILAALTAHGQTYPNKPVRMIVAFPPGQTTDIIARAIATRFAETMKQNFITDNKPGAGAIIGTELAKNAAPDGYTLLMNSSGPMAINPGLYAKLPYDPVRDFVSIGMTANVPQFLVARTDFPANTLKELIAYVGRNPGKINYASGGIGLTNHLTMELLKAATGIKVIHVPFKGAMAAITGLIGGEVELMFESGPAVVPHIKAGRLKAFAVGSPKRSIAMPDIPTVAEAGVPGFSAQAWAGLYAPAGTPQAIVRRLNAELNEALALSDLKARFQTLGAEPSPSTPEEAADFLKIEVAKWAKAVQASGARVD